MVIETADYNAFRKHHTEHGKIRVIYLSEVPL